MEGQAGDGPPAEQADVLFLVVQALHSTPAFASLAGALADSAAAQGLLPARHDIHGTRHALSFAELQQRYTHLPPNALHELLSQLLVRRRAEAPQPSARGLTSLLEGGPLRVLSAPAAAASLPPTWLRPGRSLPSEPLRLLLLRQAGLLRSAQHPSAVQPAAAYARQLAHALTVRGHRLPVYCLAYDRTGRYLITGSDDRLVKIWSTRTGLLQASCRGHDAEIADLSVSADNALVASASMDGTIRVWQLEAEEGRPGLPVSVLAGHEAAVAFLDFHPTVPDALLSASFDGTLRIWRARDASVPPIVLRTDPARFGLSGHAVTRLHGLGWPGVAGSGAAAAAAAAAGGLDGGLGVRTTRNMERQLLSLLGDGAAGTAAGASGSQQQAAGTRHSGRATRVARNLNEQAAAAERAQAGDEGEEEGEEEGADGDGGGGGSGLLVCGFSKDGTHIVAGGNDCSVYVWQWDVAQPGAAAEEQPGPKRRGRQAGRAAAGAAPSPAMSPRATAAAGQQAQQPEAAAPEAAATAAAGGEAKPPEGVEAPSGGAPLAQAVASPAGPEPRSQQEQQPPAAARQEQQRGATPGGTPPHPVGVEDAPWPVPKEVCQLKGHRNDVILLQFSHSGDRVATASKDGSVRVWRRPKRWRKRVQAWEQECTFAVLADPEAIKEARRRRRPPPAPSVDQVSWSADDQRLCVSITDYGIRVLEMPGGKLLHHLNIHANNVHVLECHPLDPSLAFSASYDGTLAVWDQCTGAVLRRFNSRNTRPDGRSWPDLLPFSDGHFSADGRSITVSDVAGQLHHYALGPRCELLARAPYDQFLTTDYNALIRDLAHNVVDADTQLPPHVLTGREGLCDALGNPYPEPLQAAFRAQRVLSAPAEEVAWLEPGKEPGYLLAAPGLTAAAWAAEAQNGSQHAIDLAIGRAQERLTVHEDRLDAGATAAAAREAAVEAVREPRRQRGAAWAAAEEEVLVEEAGESESSGEEYAQDVADSDEDVDSALLTSEEEDSFSEDEDAGEGGGRRSRGRRAAEPSRQSRRLAGRQASGRRGREDDRAAPARPAGRRAGAAPAAGGAARGAEDVREERQRADRHARAARRQAVQQARLAEERHRRQRAAAARRRRSAADSSDEEISEASEEEASPSQQPAAGQARGSRRRGRAEMEAGAEEGAVHSEDQAEERRQRKRARRAQGGGRELVNYSWLSVSDQQPGVYVPQAGDAVVYLREGHEQFLASTNDKRPPPWTQLRQGRSIRPAELCTVVDVQYVIANDGSEHTLAQLTLSFADDRSPLKDTCFTVEVPPPVAGHVEYVVHRSRFEASLVTKCWEVGDRCQAYWNDDEGTGAGAWWAGTIVADQRQGRNADVLADPFSAGGLWDRYEVQWQGMVGPDGELVDGQAENSFHCPWELYMPGTTNQAAILEAPSINAELTQRMLAGVEAASQQDRFVIFVAAPEHDEMYVSRNRRTQHYNRLVALPLSLNQLSDRLRRGYYRQPAALASDIATIASNAVAFNGDDSELAEDAAALAAYLTAVMQGQEPELAAYATFPEDTAAAAAQAVEEAERRRGRLRPRRPRQRGDDEDEEMEEGDLEGADGEGVLPIELPPLDPSLPLPPMPLPDMPALPLPLPALPLPGGQPEQQAQQQERAWPSGPPGSSSPRAGAVLAGFGASARPASGGGMRVRFSVPQHLRAAAAASAAAGGGAQADGLAVAEGSQGSLRSALAAAAAALTAAQGGGAAPGSGPAQAAALQPPLPMDPASGTAPEQQQAAASSAAPPGPGAPLAALFADVAASLVGGPSAGGSASAQPGPAAAAASGAPSAGQPGSDPLLAWFGGQGVPQAAGAPADPGMAAPWQQQQQQQQAWGRAGTAGRPAADKRGGSDEEYAPEEEAEEPSSSDSEDAAGARGRQRRSAGAGVRRRQGGARTSGRARQQRTYKESDEEDSEGDGSDAWERPAPRQRQQRATRARPKQRRQDSEEDWLDEEEEEDGSSSGVDGGGLAQRRSGRQGSRRR